MNTILSQLNPVNSFEMHLNIILLSTLRFSIHIFPPEVRLNFTPLSLILSAQQFAADSTTYNASRYAVFSIFLAFIFA
jgi:hypothetical protein